VLGEFQLVEERRRSCDRVADLIDAGDKLQVLFDGQVFEELGLVRNERELALGGDRFLLQVVPGNSDGAGCGRQIPARQRSVVVFPAPLGPTRPRTSPGATSKESSRTATRSL
jgi:hypothetical protein